MDLEDLLGHTIGSIVSLFAFLLSAAWIGTLICGVAWLAGTGEPFQGTLHGRTVSLWLTPQMLVNSLLFINLAVLSLIAAYVMVSGNSGHRLWAIIVAVESVFAMAGADLSRLDPVSNAALWTIWFFVMAAVLAAAWFLHRRMLRRLMRHTEDVRVENHIRTVERAMAAWF